MLVFANRNDALSVLPFSAIHVMLFDQMQIFDVHGHLKMVIILKSSIKPTNLDVFSI